MTTSPRGRDGREDTCFVRLSPGVALRRSSRQRVTFRLTSSAANSCILAVSLLKEKKLKIEQP